MKYLIQNRKEFIISCGVFLTFILIAAWSVWSIITGQFTGENVIAIIGAIIEFCGWYYNMPTSEENCIATGQMRLQKEQKRKITGENFFDDVEVFEAPDEEEQ